LERNERQSSGVKHTISPLDVQSTVCLLLRAEGAVTDTDTGARGSRNHPATENKENGT